MNLILKDEFKKWLVDASDETRLDEIRYKRRGWQNSRTKHPNINGYRFELLIWDFFLSLKPNYISNINLSATFDLEKIEKKNLPKLDGETIEAYKDSPETDIVAVFDRHIFVIECKSTKENLSYAKLKSRTTETDSLRTYKNLRIKSLLGEDNDLIPIHMICSDGFVLNDEDHKKCLTKHNIILFSEKYREYIQTVINFSQSPEFAFIQLLGFFRKNKPDYGAEVPIDAFHSKSGKNKKHNVYTFSISPEDMLKVSTVSHQAKTLIFDESTRSTDYYQRLLTKGRVKDISEWLEESQTPFPNNILVSYRGKKKLKWEPNTPSDDNKKMGKSVGILKFDACPGTFHVIDGQHRLFGYTGVDKKKLGIRENHRLVVTAFEGMSPAEEAEMFLEVNEKARPVSPALIMEIQYASQKVFFKNLATSIVFKLRDNESSCVLKINRADGEGSRGGMSPKDLQTSISKMKILGGEKGFNKSYFWSKNGQLDWEDLEDCAMSAFEQINILLNVVKVKNKDFWFTPTTKDKKNGKEGILQNVIFGGLLGVIDRVISVETRTNRPDVKDISTACKKYIKTLANNLNKEDDEELNTKTFNPLFYERGDAGGQQVAAYLVNKYLAKDYKQLVEEKDEAKLRLIGDLNRSKEEMELIEKNRKGLLIDLSKQKNKIEKPKAKKSPRNVRATRYHNLLKIMIHAMFMRPKHLNGEPWNALIVPNMLHKKSHYESKVGGFTIKKEIGFKRDLQLFNEKTEKAGSNMDDHSIFKEIEGKDLSFLLSHPELIKNSKPKKNSMFTNKQQIDNTLAFVHKNFLILPGKKKIDDKMPKESDPIWKDGTKYIELFYEFRCFDQGDSLESAHFTGNNTLEAVLGDKFSLFDDYEVKFRELIEKVKEELDIDRKWIKQAYED